MTWRPRSGDLSPGTIAALYLLGGLTGLVLSDVYLPTLVESHARLHWLQAFKGVLEVSVTAALLFVAAVYSKRTLTSAQRKIRRDQEMLQVLLRLWRHDIRNDMTVIRGYAETASAHSDDETVRAACGEILEATDGLLAQAETINDIRDLVAGAGETVTFDLPAMLEEIVAAADARGRADVELSVEDCADPEVEANSLLPTAIAELVENAIEHGDAAEPTVRVVLLECDETARIAVEDDGPGIPATEREVLTEGVETPLKHSSGIGLWAVNWIATASDGTIEIVDREPTGTTVELSLHREPGGPSGARPA